MSRVTVPHLSLIPRAAGLAIVVAGALALWPGRAEATCGNYLTILGHHPMQGDESSPPAVPCHGPTCSQQPAVPFVPLPAPVNSGPDAKGVMAGLHAEPGVGAGPAIPASCDGETVLRPSSIFHPPRA